MASVSHISDKSVQAKWTPPARQAARSARKRRDLLARVNAAWQATVNFVAPFGYEDETGFHSGEQPKSLKANHSASGLPRKPKHRKQG